MSDEISSLNVKMESDTVVPKLSVYYSTISCLFLSLIYVGSLYVWRSEHNRYADFFYYFHRKNVSQDLLKSWHLHWEKKKKGDESVKFHIWDSARSVCLDVQLFATSMNWITMHQNFFFLLSFFLPGIIRQR